jgi:hypothetical protein
VKVARAEFFPLLVFQLGWGIMPSKRLSYLSHIIIVFFGRRLGGPLINRNAIKANSVLAKTDSGDV